MEFSFRQPKKRTESSSQAAKVLPELILERISSGAVRSIPDSEILDRKLNELQKKRLELFLQLSKESQARDAFVLSENSDKKMKKKIAEAEKKIADVEEKIKENLRQVQEEIDKVEEKSQGIEKKDESFLPFNLPFFTKNEENEIVQENVVLYKKDFKALFAPSDSVRDQGFESWAFEKEVLGAGINGLITGTITSYGEYCSVTVDIRTYPSGKIIGSVTEVGMISELIPLANLISQNLSSKIANSLPVKLEFDIEPPEIFEKSVVNIDGIVQSFTKKNKSVLLDSGIHRIVVESEGYETLSTAYSFTDENVFSVKVKMIPLDERTFNIRLKKFKDGLFYVSGVEGTKTSPEAPYSTLTVNGKTALGVFKSSEESFKKVRNKEGKIEEKPESNIAFFRITENNLIDGAYLVTNAKPYDRAANIDKRRRWMYTAYTCLICSLPATFYTMGQYKSEVDYAKKYNNGYTTDGVEKWGLRYDVASGISIAFGVWAAVELVRYLYAADKVLPVNAKIDKKSSKFLTPVIEEVEDDVQPLNPETEIKEESVENNLEPADSDEEIIIEKEEIEIDNDYTDVTGGVSNTGTSSIPVYSSVPEQFVEEVIKKKKENRDVYTYHFEPDEAELLKGEFDRLKTDMEKYKQSESAIFIIEGYCADVDNGIDDFMLSVQRALLVYKKLEDVGIRNNRKIPVGNNSAEPVGNNKTDEGRAQNRRVEITIIEN